jgi:hypothetical protein
MTPAITLSDSQLVLLSEASRRDDGLLVRPKYLRRNALDKLARAALIEPVIVTTDNPAWYENEESVRHGYRITEAGRLAIGLEPQTSVEQLVLGSAAMLDESRSDDDAVVREKILVRRHAGSKRALVLSLLQQAQGASVTDLMNATGWLAHTTRAALSGLRKQGVTIERIQAPDGPRRYRVAASTGEPDSLVLANLAGASSANDAEL